MHTASSKLNSVQARYCACLGDVIDRCFLLNLEEGLKVNFVGIFFLFGVRFESLQVEGTAGWGATTPLRKKL